MSTPVTIVGNLTNDPELRFTPSGAAVANFTIAVNERKKNPTTGEWEDGDTSFFRCAAWRDMAENVAESLSRGMRVIVVGDLKIRSYEKTDGSGKGLSPDINVKHVGPDLTFATAKVTRASRGNGGGGNSGGNAGAAGDPWGAPQGAEEPPF